MEEPLIKLLHKEPFLSIIADECTDVTTIEGQTICCWWVESDYQKKSSLKFYP